MPTEGHFLPHTPALRDAPAWSLCWALRTGELPKARERVGSRGRAGSGGRRMLGFGEVKPSGRSQSWCPWMGLVAFSFVASGLPAVDGGGLQRSLMSTRLSSTAFANLVEEVSLQP